MCISLHVVHTLWAVLVLFFVLINIVADKMRPWSSFAWIAVAGIITVMLRGKAPGSGLRMMITVFVLLASAWYRVMQYRKETHFRS